MKASFVLAASDSLCKLVPNFVKKLLNSYRHHAVRGTNFYAYIGLSNHAFKLIGSWAAMALVELLLPWNARPLLI